MGSRLLRGFLGFSEPEFHCRIKDVIGAEKGQFWNRTPAKSPIFESRIQYSALFLLPKLKKFQTKTAKNCLKNSAGSREKKKKSMPTV